VTLQGSWVRTGGNDEYGQGFRGFWSIGQMDFNRTYKRIMT
jgi:hypothetical protein